MEIIKPTQAEWLNEVKRHIEGGIHKIGYVVIEKPVAIVHRAYQVDEDVCKALGYDIAESFNNGGTILATKGDIIFSHLDKPDNGWIFGFVAYFLDWLKAKGLNAVYENNDILIDGYKVCGVCVTRYGRIDFSSAILTVNTNLDHIKAICKKPMKKVPKGLSEYGITTEEVEEMFLAFCNTTEDNIIKDSGQE